MIKTIFVFPFSFWVALGLLVYGMLWARGRLRDGLGLPMMAVLGTVAAWYVGDAFYNDYQENYMWEFTPEILGEAWWEVALFVVVFLVVTPQVHYRINKREIKYSSQVRKLLRFGVMEPQLQLQMHRLLGACLIVWTILSFFAIIRLKEEAFHYFFPYVGYRVDPWLRGRIGGGIDSVLSFASHLQLFIASVFGISAALIKNRRLRALALLGCLFTWPYFIFDRRRNTMLSAVIPGILAWIFLRLRGSVMEKGVILILCFLLINAWFGFVLANRSTTTITLALNEKGFDWQSSQDVHHEGLNMYEELCWINTFIESGIYTPNWGARYFAEMVNPIPRALWPNKPMIGIDYAIMRGHSSKEDDSGVITTISTGMIGQGVVNFGRILGPAFAALLMSFWAVLLARLDLHGQKIGRLPLFGLGLILTFNLGRDITLITLYTFVFGGMIVWLVEYFQKKAALKKAQTERAMRAWSIKLERSSQASSAPSPREEK